jgi:hypothetical protein
VCGIPSIGCTGAFVVLSSLLLYLDSPLNNE